MVRSRVAPTSLLLLTCLVLSVHLRAQEDPVKAAVRSVKEKYAPDRRVVVFDITTEAQAGNVSSREMSMMPAFVMHSSQRSAPRGPHRSSTACVFFLTRRSATGPTES